MREPVTAGLEEDPRRSEPRMSRSEVHQPQHKRKLSSRRPPKTFDDDDLTPVDGVQFLRSPPSQPSQPPMLELEVDDETPTALPDKPLTYNEAMTYFHHSSPPPKIVDNTTEAQSCTFLLADLFLRPQPHVPDIDKAYANAVTCPDYVEDDDDDDSFDLCSPPPRERHSNSFLV